jgi:hypothetical protein
MSARVGFAWIFILLFCVAGAYPAESQKALYRSNGFGMAVEKIASYRCDEYEFVLEVDTKPISEIRRLYRNGIEVRRWEKTGIEDGKRRENEFEARNLVAARIYGSSGELLREDAYQDGALAQRTVYKYVKGSLSALEVTKADGMLVYRDEFFLSSRGPLREVRRTYPDGASASSRLVTGGGSAREERDTLSGISLIIRYDDRARAVEKEQWKADKLVVKENFVFRGDSDLLSESTEDRPESDMHISRTYDERGRLSAEQVTVGVKPTEQTEYRWDDDGRNTRKRRRSSEGIEEWLYSYDAGGKPTLEEYSLKGSLVKKTYHTGQGERYEELYREGEMFLRVYFSGDAKIKEQVYEGGVLVRERSIE